MGSLAQHKLPTIDFTKEIPNSLNKAKNDVVTALEEYGCFIAVYDKVSLELHQSVFDALKELFDLPTEIKMQNKSTKPLYGYVGQIPIIPLYESMGIDDANTLEGMKSFTKVMWPQGNDNFSETLASYSKLVAELECMVVKMVFETYRLEKCYDSYADSASYLCRVMKYRPAEANESNTGFVSHTDKSFMTIIHQNQICGLEIKAKDGQWFGVDDLSPSSFVVMAGDAILAWSNGRIRSPHHRVMMNSNKARYTLAQFSFMRSEVKAPDELVDDEHPLQFKPFNHIEYLNFYSQPENRKLESSIRTYCGV